MTVRVLVVFMVGLVVAACGQDVEGPPDLTANLGIVAWDDPPATLVEAADLQPDSGWSDGNWGNRPPLIAPASVTGGVPFTVEATTARPNGCWYPGEHEKAVAGSVATITVYDHRSDADACTLVFSWTTREIEIQFDEPGEAVIRLVGRRVAGDDFGGGEEWVIEQTISVK